MDLTATLDEIFKFKIGDVVTHRLMAEMAAEDGAKDLRRSHEAQRMLVTDRLLEQCPGGVQLHYKVRPVMRMALAMGDGYAFTDKIFDVREIELAPFRAA